MRYTYIADPNSKELMLVHRAIGTMQDNKTIELYYYSVKKTFYCPIDFTSKEGILFSCFETGYHKKNSYRIFLPETHEYFGARVMLDGVDSVGEDRNNIRDSVHSKLNSIFLEVETEYNRAKGKT